jgi:Protein of unknown function (DUF2637)
MSAADRAIRISTAAAVLAVAGIAAYVSYWHAFEVIRTHGENGATARVEPATIDDLVYASSMVILYAARHRLAVPSLARLLLALGIVATLAANVAHGWTEGPVGAVVAAWPAASLLGSYELLLWLVRTAADGGATREPTSEQTPDQVISGTDPDSDPAGQSMDDVGVASAVELGLRISEQEMNVKAVAAYHASLESGKPPSERKLAAMFGKTSRRWARSRMAEARETSEAPDNQDDEQPFYPQQRAGRSVRPDPAVREAVSTR